MSPVELPEILIYLSSCDCNQMSERHNPKNGTMVVWPSKDINLYPKAVIIPFFFSDKIHINRTRRKK